MSKIFGKNEKYKNSEHKLLFLYFENAWKTYFKNVIFNFKIIQYYVVNNVES